MKLWATAQLKTYPNGEVCQAVAVRMGGKAEGFAMQLLEEVETKEWRPWLDTTDPDGRKVEGLQTLIQKRFTKEDRPEIMLK